VTLELQPRNLHQLLWWQCAQHFTEGSQLRRCAHCGEWFVIRPPDTRSSKIYCSHNCNMAAYRLRKKEKQS
jgi:hypothetical protein